MKTDGKNYEERALDYIEGAMDEAQRAEFEKFLATDDTAREEVLSLMDAMTVLAAPAGIYPEKAALMKKGGNANFRRVLSYLGGAAAASVVVALLVWFTPDAADKSATVGMTVRRKTAPAGTLAHSAPPAAAGGIATGTVADAGTPTSVAASLADSEKERGDAVSHPDPVTETEKVKPSGALPDVIRESDAGGHSLAGHYEAPVLAGVEVPRELRYNVAALSRVEAPADYSGREMFMVASAEGEEQGESPAAEDSAYRRLAMLLVPVDMFLPVSRFETNDEKGIVIASLIRIARKK